MSKPVEYRSEFNKVEKRCDELLVPGADAADEVLDTMATSVVSVVKCGRPPTVSFRRNADGDLLATELRAEKIGIEALVRDCRMPTLTCQQGFDRMQVAPLASGQTKGGGATSAVHNGHELSIDTAFGATDGLGGLPPTGIRAVLMQLDMRVGDVPLFALRTRRDVGEHASKQYRCAPASEAGIDRTPQTEAVRQIPQQNPRTQNVKDRDDHNAVVLRQPAPARPLASSGLLTVYFFNPSHTGSGGSHRWISFMRALPSSRCFTGSIDFESTP